MNSRHGFHLQSSIAQFSADAWDALLGKEVSLRSPACRHAFLLALEESGAVAAASGWQPHHAGLWQDGQLIAALPLYLKSHSWGEYVFDWAWADAYRRHGIAYYPKWLAAIPFTPIRGPRLLARDEGAREALLAGVMAAVKDSRLSSFHLLFPTEGELPALRDAGLLIRDGVQFRWENPPQTPYADFDAFLATLNHAKRKKIRQERRRAQDLQLELRWLDGDSANADDWAFFHHCYCSTYAAHRSAPYLSADFFLRLAQIMPESLRLLIAQRNGKPRAAAFFLCDGNTLYGRYWGAVEHLPFAHFELCYYQPIEYCIGKGLRFFEGGAQGEHKMARGLMPIRTRSAHWIADGRFRNAVDDFLTRERSGIGFYLDELAERLPFRAGRAAGNPESGDLG